MGALLFLLDAMFDEIIPIAVQVDGAKVQHCLSTVVPPTHPGSLHPILD
jgi:hypothetical protein